MDPCTCHLRPLSAANPIASHTSDVDIAPFCVLFWGGGMLQRMCQWDVVFFSCAVSPSHTTVPCPAYLQIPGRHYVASVDLQRFAVEWRVEMVYVCGSSDTCAHTPHCSTHLEL